MNAKRIVLGSVVVVLLSIASLSAARSDVADAVMKGGILLACHHGLEDAQIDHIHDCFDRFAKDLAGQTEPLRNCA